MICNPLLTLDQDETARAGSNQHSTKQTNNKNGLLTNQNKRLFFVMILTSM